MVSAIRWCLVFMAVTRASGSCTSCPIRVPECICPDIVGITSATYSIHKHIAFSCSQALSEFQASEALHTAAIVNLLNISVHQIALSYSLGLCSDDVAGYAMANVSVLVEIDHLADEPAGGIEVVEVQMRSSDFPGSVFGMIRWASGGGVEAYKGAWELSSTPYTTMAPRPYIKKVTGMEQHGHHSQHRHTAHRRRAGAQHHLRRRASVAEGPAEGVDQDAGGQRSDAGAE